MKYICCIFSLAVWQKDEDTSDIDDVNDIIDDACSDVTSDVEHDMTLPDLPRSLISREQTAISLADFYGPSPSPSRDLGKNRVKIKYDA